MRCPLTTCKHVFIVGDLPRPPLPLQGTGPQQAGSVGELIPLLPVDEPPGNSGQHVSEMLPLLHAEPMEPEPLPPLERVEPPSWQNAPPPVRKGAPKTLSPIEPLSPRPETKPRREPPAISAPPALPEPLEPLEEVPDEPPPPAWQDAPPPIRRGAKNDAAKEPEAAPSRRRRSERDRPEREHEPEPVPLEHLLPHQPRGKWARWVILPFVAVTVVALSAAGYVVWITFWQNEEKMAGKADEQYAAGLYRDASQRYAKLIKDFPGSDNLERYRFREDLSDIRYHVGEKPEKPADWLEPIEGFLKEHQKEPLLSEHSRDVGETVIKLMTEYCETAENTTDEEPLKVLSRAAGVIKLAREIRVPKGSQPPDWSKLDAAVARVKQAVARVQQKKRILARLQKIASKPSFQALLRLEAAVKEEEPNLPGLGTLPEVRNLVARIYDGHKEGVTYVTNPSPPAATRRGGKEEPAILFDPLLQGAPGNAPRNDGIVLALSRGVLYALQQSTGRVKWATRVGIDTTALPVRVPAGVGSRERILVLSSDTSTLTALDNDANPLWSYRLGAPCLGQPVVVDQRAYLATYDGDVHEIELVEGKRLGVYRLGQPLTLGGVREPRTNRVYFPADEGCVYVLDVARRTCEMILYTRHPGGSLRGEPFIVSPEGDDRPGFLILNQTNGLRGVQLRVFDLPVTDRHASDRPLDPRATLEGWTWFQPYHDPEKVVMLSDAGVLGLFGLKQARNRDQALFPLLPAEENRGGLSLRPFLGGDASGRMRGRAEVVQVQADDFWVLASGRLQKLRLAWGMQVGPRIVPAWKDALEVGSPLHRSQAVEDRFGRTSLVLVTQPPRRSTCWVSCVDDDAGVIRWRRQLGLVCATAPLPMPMPAGGPLFLALDKGGALCTLDPARYVVKPGTEWASDSRNVLAAGSLDENPDREPAVLPAEDGKSAWVIASPGGRGDLVVRHVTPAAEGRGLGVVERTVRMPAAIGGTPAVVGARLVVPLANGVLARLPLPLPQQPPDPDLGADWRADRAAPDSPGHVLDLGAGRFLTTDGARGLTCWEWPANQANEALPKGHEPPTLELPDRIVSPPLRLPTPAGAPAQVWVADSAGNVSLIEVQGDGALVVKKTWKVGGIVTAGPYLEKAPRPRIGCVVAGSRLAWIDPARGVLWEHRTREGDAIVGLPRLAEGMVVVADQSGRYVGLNPATGEPLGDGYALRGSVAPVATPVEFTKGRLLAPLSDGTVMLLSTKKLRKK
jgi:outer membrane protein assembly factor BamB